LEKSKGRLGAGAVIRKIMRRSSERRASGKREKKGDIEKQNRKGCPAILFQEDRDWIYPRKRKGKKLFGRPERPEGATERGWRSLIRWERTVLGNAVAECKTNAQQEAYEKNAENRGAAWTAHKTDTRKEGQ